MTDIYKKLYGYEDDIQLRDDDIKTLETGMNLRKMRPNKQEFDDRYYKLDLNNNQLVASTKEFRMKEKLYPLVNLNEIKVGCASDNLKSYKLKKSIMDKKKIEDMENLAFVIVYDNYKKSLDLMAPNEQERSRWVRVLNYFILLTKKRKGVFPEADTIMRNYFQLADKGNDKKVNESELNKFLKSINLKLDKEELRKLIMNSDENNDGQLSEEEFQKFMQQIYVRRELISLYKLIASNEGKSNVNFIPEYMSFEKLKKFLTRYQNETVTDEDCKKVIYKYEPNDENKKELKLTLYGFMSYLNNPEQFIENPEHHEKIYQNMNLPFSYYFINSSHNTYLVGDQLTSESRPEGYIAAIMNGARLLEMDVYDGGDSGPKIFHSKTLTSKLLFEDALIAVKEYAFKLTDLPLIITIELHCSAQQQKVMAFLIKKYLKDYLFLDYDANKYPTLNDLRKKIIIRARKSKKVADNALVGIFKEATGQKPLEVDEEVEETDETDSQDLEGISEVADLLNVLHNATFKGIDYAFQNYTQSQTSSLSEIDADKMISSNNYNKIIEYTTKYLAKIYPAFYRQNSSNINPLSYWIYGFQIAALNFQTDDTAMKLNKALFNDNGNCGYVLKPEILTNPSLNFNPLDANTMNNKKTIEIKIISAQNIPITLNDSTKDISDPFVVVSIHGVPCDFAEKKTKTVRDNGFNPIWNEDFKFTVNCPELAFVKFTVKDQDTGVDDILGHYSIRFDNIRPGYRHIKLINKEHRGTLFVGIKINSTNKPATTPILTESLIEQYSFVETIP